MSRGPSTLSAPPPDISQGYDGTVVKVYGPSLYHIGPNGPEFPLLSQEVPRMAVPQTPYTCGNTQKEWEAKPAVYFFTRGRHGVRLIDALQGKFEGIDERDAHPFGQSCRGITIRMHVGSRGYHVALLLIFSTVFGVHFEH